MLKVVVLLKAPVLKVPVTVLLPDHPFEPFDAVQEFALLDVQLITLDPLKETLFGLAEILTVGLDIVTHEVVVKEVVAPTDVPFWFCAIAA